MLTDGTFISLLLLLFPVGQHVCDGATVTWGQVNRYASTLHAQDVYLAADAIANHTDVVYGLTVSTAAHSEGSERKRNKSFHCLQPESISEGYTITAVHAYDMTEGQGEGDGGSVELLSGGVGQQKVALRFRRHAQGSHLPTVHFQLIIYGLDL